MEFDYWILSAKKSSEKQAKFFGDYGAWRPYLIIMIDATQEVDDKLMLQILEASFYDEVIQNVNYKKKFRLEKNDTYEFQYARMLFTDFTSNPHFTKFRRLNV